MNENISRLELYFGDSPIEGCTELTSSVNVKAEGICEYLSSRPYAYIQSDGEQLVVLTLRGNFNDYSQAELSPFRIIGSGMSISYGVCKLLSDREYSRDGIFYRELKLGCSNRSIDYE